LGADPPVVSLPRPIILGPVYSGDWWVWRSLPPWTWKKHGVPTKSFKFSLVLVTQLKKKNGIGNLEEFSA